MEINDIILHLSLIDGVGPSTIAAIVDRKPWDIELHDLYQMSSSDIMRIFSISLAKAESIVAGLADSAIVERELELAHKYNISWMTLYHKQYPELLKHIYLPPMIIYWQGGLPADGSKSVAVIGSRTINYYGISVIESFVPKLVAAGWTIVSGGAIGADSVAHRVAVNSGGHTIVVLGSGLLSPYPASNRRLFADVIDAGGTLMSIFPIMITAAQGTFPARNRIIAGMSRGCLVAQAGKKSGTHITAHYALEQGRELFAVPGPIDNELCVGCHDLIQQGAKLVTSVSDILVELGVQPDMAFQPEKTEKEVQRSINAPAVQMAAAFKTQGVEATILRCCSSPCSLDDLAEQTGLAMSDLYAKLFELELSGAIRQEVHGMWQRR